MISNYNNKWARVGSTSKPSHFQRKPVSSSRTYIARDDDEDSHRTHSKQYRKHKFTNGEKRISFKHTKGHLFI